MATLRWVLGPSFSGTRLPASNQSPAMAPVAAPVGPVKQDVIVTLLSVDEAAEVAKLALPAYDLASYNQPMELRLYLVPVGSPLPADGPGYFASAYPFTDADVSAVQAGAEVDIAFPAGPSGPFFAQVATGFAS